MRDPLLGVLAQAMGRRALLGGTAATALAHALGGETNAKCRKKCKARKRAALIALCRDGLPGVICPGCAPNHTPFCDACLSNITPLALDCCVYIPQGLPTVEACAYCVIYGLC